ncbi:MAG: lipid-A-disaccharide synthase [Gammaproteobacteria bacterium]|nr:lipid-A-disaccharide synthase [Gammaproteobacteria bacterium]
MAGEASGDALGGALMHAVRARTPDARFIGMAGPAMLAAGCQPLAHIDELSVMGLVEVLRAYPRLRRLRENLGSRLLEARPDVFVGIDVPDFNLGLERRMKCAGIGVVHYVCPQAWAWRPGRARHLGVAVDRLLALLPFEPAFFAKHGVDCRFVGHPLADALPLDPDRAAARAALGVASGAPLLALLPGSRSQEIERLAPVFAAGAAALVAARGKCRVAACAAHAGQLERLRAAVRAAAPALEVEYLHGRARELLSAADVALVASGTATLEAMLCRAPMVVGYRLAPLSYHIIRRMISIQRIALPNILADEALVPELIQDALTPQAISAALGQWLDDDARRARYVARARQLHESLRVGAAARAADEVLQMCAAS